VRACCDSELDIQPGGVARGGAGGEQIIYILLLS